MIQIKDLTKQYKNVLAVDRLNLTINKGEIFGLLGPNGAGKTTTMMMLSTLLKPTGGTAIINGHDVLTQSTRVRECIGMVFQDPSSDTTLTAYENLKLHALLYNLPLRQIDRRIDEVLALVDLHKRKNDIVKTYSGGMRRRMEIARGLLHEPQIFFLDEPTLGLDPQTRQHIWDYIRSLAEKIGMTIILTTHYMEEADKLCNRIAIIDHGKIIALDSPDNLKRSLGGDTVVFRGRNVQIRYEQLPCIRTMERHEEYVQLTVENAGRNLPAIIGAADGVECVEVHSANLNDVFLRYTGREIRE